LCAGRRPAQARPPPSPRAPSWSPCPGGPGSAAYDGPRGRRSMGYVAADVPHNMVFFDMTFRPAWVPRSRIHARPRPRSSDHTRSATARSRWRPCLGDAAQHRRVRPCEPRGRGKLFAAHTVVVAVEAILVRPGHGHGVPDLAAVQVRPVGDTRVIAGVAVGLGLWCGRRRGLGLRLLRRWGGSSSRGRWRGRNRPANMLFLLLNRRRGRLPGRRGRGNSVRRDGPVRRGVLRPGATSRFNLSLGSVTYSG
jgi:hypothetical protein